MRARWAAIVVVLATATSLWAESVWVKSDLADIRSGKAAIYPSIAQVKKGQELTVLSRDGKWVQVQAGAIQGWIFDTSISTQKVDAGFNPFGGNVTAQMDTGAAARGWNADAEHYASSKHMTMQGMDFLKGIRDKVTPQDYTAFTSTAQGHLGQ